MQIDVLVASGQIWLELMRHSFVFIHEMNNDVSPLSDSSSTTDLCDCRTVQTAAHCGQSQ